MNFSLICKLVVLTIFLLICGYFWWILGITMYLRDLGFMEENCVFDCAGQDGTSEANVRPLPNKNSHSPGGCTLFGLHIGTEYLPAIEMEACCNAHEVCYATCNNDKALCDGDFKRCLYEYCGSEEMSMAGDLAAKLLSIGTPSCKSYLDAQERSCYCTSAENSWIEKLSYIINYYIA